MNRDNSPAAELLTSTGFTALGPVVWGSPVTSDGPGLYIVESREPSETAPINSSAVGAWVNRMPTSLVDGRTPRAGELAIRLASFWIPGEPVLYVGLAGRSVAKRVRQVAGGVGDAVADGDRRAFRAPPSSGPARNDVR